jgi:hypothetical protein
LPTPPTVLRHTSTAAAQATITTARKDVSLWNAMSHSSRACTSPGNSGLVWRVTVFHTNHPAQNAPIATGIDTYGLALMLTRATMATVAKIRAVPVW